MSTTDVESAEETPPMFGEGGEGEVLGERRDGDLIRVGDMLPAALLFENNPGGRISVPELCIGKRNVIFGIICAFAPDCIKQFATYVNRFEDLKSYGVDDIVCIVVDDVFVAAGFATAQNTEGKVRVMADPDGIFTSSIGLQQHLPELGGSDGIRSKRYSLVVINNVVTDFHVERDGCGLTCTTAQDLELK